MPQVWFTADLHLGHGNIIKYCKRPFLTPAEEEMAQRDARGNWKVSQETLRRHDDALLDNINKVVGEDDTLWILGDFCWGRLEVANQYRSRIICRDIHLVLGNHDYSSLGTIFKSVMEQGMVKVEKESIWLNHYPMRSWNKSFHGSWHLYGHVHGILSEEDKANPHWLTKDVGVDACGYKPCSFDEIVAYMAPRKEAFLKHKAEILQKGADAE